jgi:hypothetical protein
MVSNRLSDGLAGISLDIGDRRAAALREEQERVEIRQSRIDALSSPFSEPHERIRLWEELHGVRLPRAADHSLVRVIAHRTSLTVQQVQDEQRRRAGV